MLNRHLQLTFCVHLLCCHEFFSLNQYWFFSVSLFLPALGCQAVEHHGWLCAFLITSGHCQHLWNYPTVWSVCVFLGKPAWSWASSLIAADVVHASEISLGVCALGKACLLRWTLLTYDPGSLNTLPPLQSVPGTSSHRHSIRKGLEVVSSVSFNVDQINAFHLYSLLKGETVGNVLLLFYVCNVSESVRVPSP